MPVQAVGWKRFSHRVADRANLMYSNWMAGFWCQVACAKSKVSG